MKRIFTKNTKEYTSFLSRMWSGTSGVNPVKFTESDLKKTLSQKFPAAEEIAVEDISGGCGAMFEIFVRSKEFKGLTTVKQHRLITETLKEQIKDMHGLRIHTEIPSK
ncbi:bolA-like protein 3 [Lutzomyia longipalpis]|uniref:Putative bola bacterial stress-induced morphogen-related protein n=1 Tax=Lutzomyia longipalpis TaxID=7200 RepID=A0A1B0CD25_LUTLO|nr:bolA-like protein 3 [Lutzomyia longipalpis]